MAWTLVTGGAKRLGAELSVALAKAGYDVVIHYHNSHKEAEEVKQRCLAFGGQCDLIRGDFSSIEGVTDFAQRYVKQFPETENLVNNVGNYLVKSALNTSIEEWMSLFQTNLHTPFVLIKYLVPSIIRYEGCVINIGTSGILYPRANTQSTAYSLTKSSLWLLTRALAKELASQKVRVNMISPGYLDIAVDLPKDLNQLPMRRAAHCEEISRVLTFLLDRKSDYITGQHIEVAGGVGLG